MKIKVLVIQFLIFSNTLFSQKIETVIVTVGKDSTSSKKNHFDWEEIMYTQLDLSVPLVLNSYQNDYNEEEISDKNWFLPNGLAAKLGVGVEAYEVIGFSLNTGLDWKINPKMVIVPVFGNTRLNIGLANDNQILLQAGLGKGFALGRGGLAGNYFRYNVGYGEIDDTNVFVELSGYKFRNFPQRNFGSISVGLTFKI